MRAFTNISAPSIGMPVSGSLTTTTTSEGTGTECRGRREDQHMRIIRTDHLTKKPGVGMQPLTCDAKTKKDERQSHHGNKVPRICIG